MIMENKRSSETLREVTSFFQFAEFHKRNPFPQQPQSFYEWFVGFAEGDGSFILSYSKDSRLPNSVPRQRAIFTLTQKEPKVLFLIKKKFGFGSVTKHGKDAFRWSVTKNEHLKLICLLVKDNLVLASRQEQLDEWCEFFGFKRANKLGYPVLLETGWLAGFIDAEGCLSRFEKKDKRYKNGVYLVYSFTLDQNNGSELFSHIKLVFGGGNYYHRKETSCCYRYANRSKKTHRTVLLPYLKRFPCLHAKKQVEVFCWRRDLILNEKKVKEKVRPFPKVKG